MKRTTKHALSIPGIGGVLLWLVAALAQAQPQFQPQSTRKPVATQPIPMTVMAMLKVESEVFAKWQAAQNKVALRARPKPSLVSIYGVLPHLRASVLVNGREVVFEQGRKQPLYPQATSLRLRQIKPPCVSFVEGTRPQTVCLSRVGS